MEGAAQKIETLLSTGKQFTYQTFAILEPQGRWATAYSPAWVSWSARVHGAIKAIFGPQSAPLQILDAAGAIEMIGNGPDKFEQAMAFYIGALEAAEAVLQEDTFGEVVGGSAKAPLTASNRVFVVHGRDDKSKTELEVLLREFGLDPIVLHRQADGGRTLIEKFEHYSDVGFAFVMLTPDEVAYLAADEVKPDAERKKEFRARPNAIFEFGFFVGRLGRARTCCLYKSPVTVPSDLDGLVYKKFEASVEEVAYGLQKELKAAGYQLA